MAFQQRATAGRGNWVVGLVVLAVVLLGVYFVVKGLYTLLSIIAPALLIATAFIDYKVIVSFGKWVLSLFKSNWLMGIGAVLLTVFLFPLAAALLFGRAMIGRKFGQIQQKAKQRQAAEFIEYEEVNKERLELRDVKPQEKKEGGSYDNLFE